MAKSTQTISIAVLIPALLCFGCAANGAVTMAEYRPANPPTERTAPKSEVFELMHWQPLSQPAASNTSARNETSHRVRQGPVEVQRVYLPGGRPIGFRRDDGHLIAIAGETVIPLPEAHYEWKSMPSQQVEQANTKQTKAKENASGLLYVGSVIGGTIYWTWRHGIGWAFDSGD